MLKFQGIVSVLLVLIVSTGFARILWSNDHLNNRYAIVDIEGIGAEEVGRLKQSSSISWWIEAGKLMLVYADASLSQQTRLPIKYLNLKPNPRRLYLVNRAHLRDLGADVDVLVDAGRKAIIQSKSNELPRFVNHKHLDPGSHKAHANLSIFQPNLVLAQSVENIPAPGLVVDWYEGIDDMLAEIDLRKWFADLAKLATWNRNTHGSQIISARDWLISELTAMPGMNVETQSFKVRSTTAHNVVATLTGRTRPNDVYIVGAHYDSTSQSPSTAAPGAEDNGSGSAGLLQMARIFAKFPPAATVIFIAFSGEEQGLHGSEEHVASLFRSGENVNVKAVINMDMIGYTKRTDNLGVILESQEHAKSLVDLSAAAAAKFCDTLDVTITYDAWGSDHVPYLQKGISALLTIDRDWNSYPAYHRTSDTTDKVAPEMAEQILRMNIATLAQLSF